MSFESCLASATWWLAFVLLEQQSVLCTIWTLIMAHLSNLLMWKELRWRSACKVVKAEAKRCALLFGEVIVSSPSLMLLIHPSGVKCAECCFLPLHSDLSTTGAKGNLFFWPCSQWLQGFVGILWLRDDKWMLLVLSENSEDSSCTATLFFQDSSKTEDLTKM